MFGTATRDDISKRSLHLDDIIGGHRLYSQSRMFRSCSTGAPPVAVGLALALFLLARFFRARLEP